MRLAATLLACTLALALASGAAAQAPSGDAALLGDTDCDGRVSSIDAALILQFAAALTDSLPCQDNGDLSADGSVNAVDAALVLQIVAGLAPGIAPMSVAVEADAADCDDPAHQTSCDLPAGATFDLVVSLDGQPPTGYVMLGTYVFHDLLTYEPTEAPATEILWPQNAFTVRGVPGDDAHRDIGVIAHGAMSAQHAPFPSSDYLGPVLRLRLGCPAEPASYTIALRPYDSDLTIGSGVGYPRPGGHASVVHPMQTVASMDLDLDLDGTIEEGEGGLAVGAALTVNCV